MSERSAAPAAARVRDAVHAEAPDLPLPVLVGFLERLDRDYFAREQPPAIALHARLAATLRPERPARVAVTPRESGRYDVAVVAHDFFAEFAIVCGLLAAHALDIEQGHAHTLAAAEAPPRTAGRRRPQPAPSRQIVDVFRVRPRGGAAPDADALERELLELRALAIADRLAEARERVSRRLAEQRGPGAAPLPGALLPIRIEFDDAASELWTAMSVRGADTPGFLYALANALAMRGVYVHAVAIESVRGEARDRFLIGRRGGGKITDPEELDGLRLAVALIKQFTHVLPLAPDPALAIRDFDQLLDRLLAQGKEALALFSSPAGLQELARLLGSSAFLWEDFLRMQFEHLLPVLGDWRKRGLRSRQELTRALRERLEKSPPEAAKAALNAFKDEEMLLIDMKHLLDPSVGLPEFEHALTDLADTLVAEGAALLHARLLEKHGTPRAGRRPCGFAFFGLGKFGGREMGYASDLELLAAYAAAGATDKAAVDNGHFFEELVRELSALIVAREEGIFRIDLRLRPHGGKGPLASPLAALQEYYRSGGGAAAFERQALIKLRFVAGDAALGREVERLRDDFVWSDEPWDRADALHLRDRQARELVPTGRFSVKHSRGGLVEAEYAVQYLQLLHGRRHPKLRTPSTLDALAALREADILNADDAAKLRDAYVFWRNVADALRMVRGQASDLLLPAQDSEQLELLARRLRYEEPTFALAAAALAADVARHCAAVVETFDRLFR